MTIQYVSGPHSGLGTCMPAEGGSASNNPCTYQFQHPAGQHATTVSFTGALELAHHQVAWSAGALEHWIASTMTAKCLIDLADCWRAARAALHPQTRPCCSLHL